MQLERHQRCERCQFEKEAGCVEMRHIWTEVDKALAEGAGRAARHRLKMPEAELIAWCPNFWRRGRGL